MPDESAAINSGGAQVITIEVPGIQGPPAVVKIGTVATGAAGTGASATSTRNAQGESILSFTLPRGEVGPTNSLTIGTVTTGATGTNASATVTGIAPSQVLNLTLPRGATGNTGPANTLTIGTVTTASPGANAIATITGTAPTQTLNLTIPQGPQGPQGTGITITGSVTTYSALPTNLTTSDSGKGYLVNSDGRLYIWDGSKFPASGSGATFQGPAGPANSLTIGTVSTVASGASPTATITGTAPTQVLNLGLARGDAGPANSLTIGTVTTSAAGSAASATITGTAPNQVLNLTIPQGASGVGGTGGTVTAANITDATTIGRTILTSADAATVRTAIGAGISSLAIGTTATTAMAGNTTFTKAQVGLGNVDNTADTAKPVSTAQQTAFDLKATALNVEYIRVHDGTTSGGTRPSGCSRVRWVGGSTRPTNMATGDVWEHNL